MSGAYDREQIAAFLRWLETEHDSGATVVRIAAARQFFGGCWTPAAPPVNDRAELDLTRRWLRAVSAGRATREVHAEISRYLVAVSMAS